MAMRNRPPGRKPAGGEREINRNWQGCFCNDTVRSIIRRASNPVRGRGSIRSVLLRAGHPDLFTNMILNPLTQGK